MINPKESPILTCLRSKGVCLEDGETAVIAAGVYNQFGVAVCNGDKGVFLRCFTYGEGVEPHEKMAGLHTGPHMDFPLPKNKEGRLPDNVDTDKLAQGVLARLGHESIYNEHAVERVMSQEVLRLHGFSQNSAIDVSDRAGYSKKMNLGGAQATILDKLEKHFPEGPGLDAKGKKLEGQWLESKLEIVARDMKLDVLKVKPEPQVAASTPNANSGLRGIRFTS